MSEWGPVSPKHTYAFTRKEEMSISVTNADNETWVFPADR